MQAPNYIAMFYDQLDAHLLGGTQWGWTDAFNPYTKDGWNQENFSITDQHRELRSNFAVRPYPRAIAGVPGSFQVPSAHATLPLRKALTMPLHVRTIQRREQMGVETQDSCGVIESADDIWP